MDYGPFGWVDRYEPLAAKWHGSGAHYGFMNQPSAGAANLITFARALTPLVGDKLADAPQVCEQLMQKATHKMFANKLGFEEASTIALQLFQRVEDLLDEGNVDYTIFFRQLSTIMDSLSANHSDQDIMNHLRIAFYAPKDPNNVQEEEKKFVKFVRDWMEAHPSNPSAFMKTINPKYILREYMLVDAYESANKGDYRLVNELFKLIQKPYDEQPEFEAKYYKRAPDEALTKLGTALFS